MLETSTTSRWPAGIRWTIQGSCTVTECCWPGWPVRLIGDTSRAGSVSLPSGATSCSDANRVTEPVRPAVTVRPTLDEPITIVDSGSGAEPNRAVWPGIAESWLVPSTPETLAAAPSTPPRPGMLDTAAGVPPAGVTICWLPPDSAIGVARNALSPISSG